MSPGEYTTSTGQKVEQPMCTGEEGYTYFQTIDEQGVLVKKLIKEGKNVFDPDAGVCNFLPTSQPRGMKAVLQERFVNKALRADGTLAVDVSRMTAPQLADECNRYADFQSSVSRAEILCTRFNHTCIFLPKFHPELNPIELVWRDSKEALRRVCNASSRDFKRKWHAALDALDSHRIHGYFKTAMEYEMIYDKEIGYGNEKDAGSRLHKYASHRRVFRREETKKAMLEAVADADAYVIRIKPEGKEGRKCKLADCKVRVVNQWGLLKRLRLHLGLAV
jgi:hypothetical protein